MRADLRNMALTGVVSLAGVFVFYALGLPLPWLLGPMFACLIAALLGMTLETTKRVSTAMRTILGVAVGASITPAVVQRIPDMAVSIALVPVFIALIGLVGYPYFRRLWGFNSATSYYGAMPGGLQDMLVFGEEAGASLRVLSLIHATRVLLIVSLLPILLTTSFGLDLNQLPGAPAASVPLQEMAVMVLVAVVGWKVAERVGLFGASILGPLILATVFSLSDLLHQRPPAEAIFAAQLFIGIGVGVHYVGLTVAELRRTVVAAFGYTLLLAVLSLIFVEIAIQLDLAPPVEAILAFAPGGQAEMAVIALVAGVDVAYVVTHHLVRLVVVIIGAPIVHRLFGD